MIISHIFKVGEDAGLKVGEVLQSPGVGQVSYSLKGLTGHI